MRWREIGRGRFSRRGATLRYRARGRRAADQSEKHRPARRRRRRPSSACIYYAHPSSIAAAATSTDGHRRRSRRRNHFHRSRKSRPSCIPRFVFFSPFSVRTTSNINILFYTFVLSRDRHTPRTQYIARVEISGKTRKPWLRVHSSPSRPGSPAPSWSNTTRTRTASGTNGSTPRWRTTGRYGRRSSWAFTTRARTSSSAGPPRAGVIYIIETR